MRLTPLRVESTPVFPLLESKQRFQSSKVFLVLNCQPSRPYTELSQSKRSTMEAAAVSAVTQIQADATNRIDEAETARREAEERAQEALRRVGEVEAANEALKEDSAAEVRKAQQEAELAIEEMKAQVATERTEAAEQITHMARQCRL